MSNVRRTKKVTIIAAGAVVLAGTGVAYAYWSAGGSGTGSAATGTNVALVVNQTSSVTSMGPGDTAQTLSGNFTNSNTGPAYVTSVTVSISGVTKAAQAPAGTCSASDYTLANSVMTVGAEVPPGTGQGSWSGASLKFNNSPTVNQDACKGATVALLYTIS